MSVTNWERKNIDFDEISPEFQEMYAEAHNGDVVAQNGLAKWYDVRGQVEEAEHWYKRAADQGHDGAAECLGELEL